jgi:hypothetical protein
MAKKLKIKKAAPKKASGKPAGVVLRRLTEEERTARAHALAESKRMGRPRTEPTQVGLTLLPDTLASLDKFAAREGLTRGMAARRIIELFFERG